MCNWRVSSILSRNRCSALLVSFSWLVCQPAFAQTFNLVCRGEDIVTFDVPQPENAQNQSACIVEKTDANKSGQIFDNSWIDVRGYCQKVFPTTMTEHKTSKFTHIFRVNLSTSRWCSGHCLETQPLDKGAGNYLGFIWNAEEKLFVNRETGRITHSKKKYFPNYELTGVGDCKKAAFTGMPKVKF